MWRVVVVVLGVAAALLTGCGDSGRLVVAVRLGQPGLVNQRPDGGLTGFDIAVVRYVARELGYRDDQIVFTGDAAQADLVLGTMGPAFPGGETRYVAGPYLVTTTNILVRANDLAIRGVRDLAGRCVCATGSSARPLVARFGEAWKHAFLAEANVPAACAPLLADGRCDAIVADAPVLAGLAVQYPGRFRFSGRPLATIEYGIGTSSAALRDRVTEALRHMFEDGSWKRAVIEHLGVLATRYTAPPELPATAR
ncbi:transporter substrate-binding domain-containing protein [Thermobispora bispora]|uniref:transporter substrate-binding domain-containing protein n=1 Tax=Thermobispora bispora TaxID=2006 RepID=UPI0002EE46F1|nr:transporter substrate-binding domain-containing protein [Thermobispora bispora]MBX6167245.1 transporter substrate-binding domain-containing protein [Thermobispora bispora]MDI9582238.1 transporter substrate-binding domain-containing protein [Thermobispora sp.]